MRSLGAALRWKILCPLPISIDLSRPFVPQSFLTRPFVTPLKPCTLFKDHLHCIHCSAPLLRSTFVRHRNQEKLVDIGVFAPHTSNYLLPVPPLHCSFNSDQAARNTASLFGRRLLNVLAPSYADRRLLMHELPGAC